MKYPVLVIALLSTIQGHLNAIQTATQDMTPGTAPVPTNVPTNPSSAAFASGVTVYPTPPGYHTDSSFTMTVDGHSVPVLQWTTGKNNSVEYLYSRFSLGGSAVVKISCNNGIDSSTVQPSAFGIVPHVNGHDLTFTLPGSRYFIITINKVRLIVLADPPENLDHDLREAKTYHLPASADASGERNCTEQLQSLIDSTSAKGGGVAYIPDGTFKVSPFRLKSNVTLYLSNGAALKFDTASDVTSRDFSKVIHHDHERVHPGIYFIKADDAQNIRIIGRGIIDLNGGTLFDASGSLESCMRIQNVRNLEIDGVTIRENSSWSILTAGCGNVKFRNVKVLNGMGFEQNDAFDIISSLDVSIDHCFAYARDDAYCLKGGGQGTHGGGVTTPETKDFGNISVKDCVAYTLDGSGFKIGNQSTVSGKGFSCENLYTIAGRNAVFLALFDGPATFEKITANNIFIDQKNTIPLKIQIKKGGHVKDVKTSNFFLENQPIKIGSSL